MTLQIAYWIVTSAFLLLLVFLLLFLPLLFLPSPFSSPPSPSFSNLCMGPNYGLTSKCQNRMNRCLVERPWGCGYILKFRIAWVLLLPSIMAITLKPNIKSFQCHLSLLSCLLYINWLLLLASAAVVFKFLLGKFYFPTRIILMVSSLVRKNTSLFLPLFSSLNFANFNFHSLLKHVYNALWKTLLCFSCNSDFL